MYFNSMKNVNFNGFISDDNDLQDLEIIQALSKHPIDQLFISMIVIFGGIYLFYKVSI